MDVLGSSPLEEETKEPENKIQCDVAALLEGNDIFFGSEYPSDADLAADTDLVLNTTKCSDLRKEKYNYKFFRIQTDTVLQRLQKLLINNPDFLITEVKNGLYMSIIEHIPEHHFEKLYHFSF